MKHTSIFNIQKTLPRKWTQITLPAKSNPQWSLNYERRIFIKASKLQSCFSKENFDTTVLETSLRQITRTNPVFVIWQKVISGSICVHGKNLIIDTAPPSLSVPSNFINNQTFSSLCTGTKTQLNSSNCWRHWIFWTSCIWLTDNFHILNFIFCHSVIYK